MRTGPIFTFKKASVAIGLVTLKGRAQELDGLPRENGDAVVCLLRDGHRIVSEVFKDPVG